MLKDGSKESCSYREDDNVGTFAGSLEDMGACIGEVRVLVCSDGKLDQSQLAGLECEGGGHGG